MSANKLFCPECKRDFSEYDLSCLCVCEVCKKFIPFLENQSDEEYARDEKYTSRIADAKEGFDA